MSSIASTTAILFTPDRSYTLELAPMKGLKQMSQRIFEKGPDGKTVAIRLRQQTDLGEGRLVKLTAFIVDKVRAAMPPSARRAIAPTAGAGDGRRAHPHTTPHKKSSSKKGLDMSKVGKAKRRDERRERQKQAQEGARDERRRRLEEGDELYCTFQPDGCTGCGYSTTSRKWLAVHIAAGKHTTGPDGTGHAVGTVVGRGDRMKLGADAALQGLNVARCASTPCEPCSVADAATFTFTLVTGQVVSPSPPPAGWACIKNLPQTTPSARSYEFALWAARLKLRGKALKNKEAYHEQRRVGTAAFAVDWPDDNYVKSMATTDGSPALCRMEHLEHAALKALLTKGEPYIKRQLESAKAREAKAAAKVAKPKARTSPAGGAALGAVGGATGGVAPAAKRSRDPLSVVVVQPIARGTSLTSIVKALEGGALGAAKLKHLESQWPTAGHLADVAGDTHALQVGYDAIKAALALAEARGCVPPVSSIQALAQALREHLHGGGGGGAAAAAVSAASGAGVANAPGGDTAEDPAVRAQPPPTRQTRAQRDYHDYGDDDDDEGSEIDDESEDRLLSMLYEYADDDDGEEEEEEEVDDDDEEGEVEGWD